MEIGQKVSAALKIVDRHGNPAPVDGNPVWSNSDESICAMVVSDDGMSAVFEALALGSVLIGVSADADLGQGVKSIVGSGSLSVLPAEAVGVSIEFGEPQDPA